MAQDLVVGEAQEIYNYLLILLQSLLSRGLASLSEIFNLLRYKKSKVRNVNHFRKESRKRSEKSIVEPPHQDQEVTH